MDTFTNPSAHSAESTTWSGPIGLTPEQQAYLRRPSWGSTLGMFYFASMQEWLHAGIYTALLFVPVVNFIAPIVYVFISRWLAWNAKSWESFAAFELEQRRLDRYGLIVSLAGGAFVVILVLITLWFVSTNLSTFSPDTLKALDGSYGL
jgi:hypothetical protein